MVHSREQVRPRAGQRSIDLFDPHRATQHIQAQRSQAQRSQSSTPTRPVPPLPIGTLGNQSSPSQVARPTSASVPLSSSGVHSSASFTAQSAHSIAGAPPPQPSTGSTSRQKARRSAQSGVRSPDFRYLVAGSSLLAGLALIGDVTPALNSTASRDVCQEIVQADAVLSRNSLSKLLAVPERENKAAVREVVQEPFCTMPSVEVRAGVLAEREAYPLAFDPQTWLIVLYEGEEYAGYAFSFQP